MRNKKNKKPKYVVLTNSRLLVLFGGCPEGLVTALMILIFPIWILPWTVKKLDDAISGALV